MALTIDVVPTLKDNFSYILHDHHIGAVIDPGEVDPIVQFLEKKKIDLDLILCTHHHWDHVGGAQELARRYDCAIAASKWDSGRIVACTMSLDDNEKFSFAGYSIQVLHVPGHTTGQISFYLPEQGALFTGDTLFSLGCGRLFEGTPAEMFDSLKRIATLPPETKIYFGHEYTLRNAAFALQQNPENQELKDYVQDVELRLSKGEHSTPSELGKEIRINPFMNTPSLSEWTKRRELRNVF